MSSPLQAVLTRSRREFYPRQLRKYPALRILFPFRVFFQSLQVTTAKKKKKHYVIIPAVRSVY